MNDDAYASSVAALRVNFSFPGIRAVWKTAGQNYGTAYAEFIDALIADIPVIPTADFEARFKQAVAADIAPASH